MLYLSAVVVPAVQRRKPRGFGSFNPLVICCRTSRCEEWEKHKLGDSEGHPLTVSGAELHWPRLPGKPRANTASATEKHHASTR